MCPMHLTVFFFFCFKSMRPAALPLNSSHLLHWNAVLQQFLYYKGHVLKDLMRKVVVNPATVCHKSFFGILAFTLVP